LRKQLILTRVGRGTRLAAFFHSAASSPNFLIGLIRRVYTPLIAAGASRLESTMAAAQYMARARKIKMRLIKFTNRVDVEDIVKPRSQRNASGQAEAEAGNLDPCLRAQVQVLSQGMGDG
jgi:hypothetical protein